MKNHLVAAFLCAGLNGCILYEDVERAVDERGPIRRVAEQEELNSPLYALFGSAYRTAFYAEKNAASAEVQKATAGTMLKSGYAVVYQNCNEWFNNSGDRQKWIVYGREMFDLAGATAMGILGSSQSPDATGVVGLIVGTTDQSVDLYARHFLFGQENIGAVRTMALKAVAESGDTNVKRFQALPGGSFSDAFVYLLEIQDTCGFPNLRRLVTESIRKSTPEPANPAPAAAATNAVTEPPVAPPPPVPTPAVASPSSVSISP